MVPFNRVSHHVNACLGHLFDHPHLPSCTDFRSINYYK